MRRAAMLPSAVLLAFSVLVATRSLAQAPNPPSGLPEEPTRLLNPPQLPSSDQRPGPQPYTQGTSSDRLLATPVTKILPGAVKLTPDLKSPVGNDPQAIERGMRYFNAFNCVGCHAPNAGGGMGPGLSTGVFTYGSEPANIYLSIYQGRPHGMPAWGEMLPENVIWDLVAYLRSISTPPDKTWGSTVNRQQPQIEQVPAEILQTANPWSKTETFSHGQKPGKSD